MFGWAGRVARGAVGRRRAPGCTFGGGRNEADTCDVSDDTQARFAMRAESESGATEHQRIQKKCRAASWRRRGSLGTQATEKRRLLS